MVDNEKLNWHDPPTPTLPPRSYKCGHCGEPIASEKGYQAVTRGDISGKGKRGKAYLYICHFCTKPTFFNFDGKQIPGIPFGGEVKEIDDEKVRELYLEARNATSANCHTAAVLSCRKLLMHIAVSKGAVSGKSFASYVKYLSDNNYVPPGAKDWVDHIRSKGNEANHEINIMNAEDSKELIEFSEMLLKIIFEFPATVQKKYSNSNSAVDSGN